MIFTIAQFQESFEFSRLNDTTYRYLQPRSPSQVKQAVNELCRRRQPLLKALFASVADTLYNVVDKERERAFEIFTARLQREGGSLKVKHKFDGWHQ